MTHETTALDSDADIAVVDVGGTRLRRAVWSPARGLREPADGPSPSMRTHPGLPAGQLRRLMVEALCAAVAPGTDRAGVSFGAALDHHSGTVYASAPLWGADTEPFDLLGALRPVLLDTVQFALGNCLLRENILQLALRLAQRELGFAQGAVEIRVAFAFGAHRPLAFVEPAMALRRSAQSSAERAIGPPWSRLEA